MQNSCDVPGFELDAEARDDSPTNESPGYNNDNVDSVTDGVESEADPRLRCGPGCLKSLVVLVNLTFMAGGLVLIGLIIWIHVYRESFIYYRLIEDAASSLHPQPPHFAQQHQHQQQHIPSSVIQKTTVIVVITLVVVVIAIGFLGCCGASVESMCFLCLCVVLIVSVIIAEIVIVSVVPSFKEKMYSDLLGRMSYQIRVEYNRTTTATATTEEEVAEKLDVQQLTHAWDTLQTRFNCCGVSGPRDFLESTWYNQTKDHEGLYVPMTCCVLEDSEKPVARNPHLCQIAVLLYKNTEMPLTEIHVMGCHEAFINYVESLVSQPLIVALFSVIIILQLIDLIFCCILILWINRKLREIDASLNDDSDQDDVDED